MCKVILKENGQVIFQKQFADLQKAESLKNVFDRFLDTSKVEILLESGPKVKKRKTKNANN